MAKTVALALLIAYVYRGKGCDTLIPCINPMWCLAYTVL